ncbi:MAG: hypothetical protein HUJ93_08680 [Bacteroidales bacterium]|nr:hypothetical protein [Bacteroidales bacterium]
MAKLDDERRMAGFPPYSRMISIIVRDKYEGRVWRACSELEKELRAARIIDFMGPVAPVVERVAGVQSRVFWIKVARDRSSGPLRRALAAAVEKVRSLIRPEVDIIIDVDPL